MKTLYRQKTLLLSCLALTLIFGACIRSLADTISTDSASQVRQEADTVALNRVHDHIEMVDSVAFRHLLNMRNKMARKDENDDNTDENENEKGQKKGKNAPRARRGRKRGQKDRDEDDERIEDGVDIEENAEQKGDNQEVKAKRRKRNKQENLDGDDSDIQKQKGVDKNGDGGQNDERQKDNDTGKKNMKKKARDDNDDDAEENNRSGENEVFDKGGDEDEEEDEEEDRDKGGDEDGDEDGDDEEKFADLLKKQEKEKEKIAEKKKEKIQILGSKENLQGKALPPKNIAFCHIERTGGTTFKHILLDFAKKHNTTDKSSSLIFGSLKKIGKPSKPEDKNTIIYGKNKYLGMRKKLCCGFYYFTLIRHPLERLLSKYISHTPLNSHKQIIPSTSFYDYLIRNSKTEHANEQCKHLGIASKSEIPLIVDSFDLVIVTDMFDEGLLLLKDEFEIDTISYSPRRVTQGVPKVKDIDKRYRTLVELTNSCDVALYSYAKRKITERLNKRYKSNKAIQEKLSDFRSGLPKVVCVDDELPSEENEPLCDLMDYKKIANYLSQIFLYPEIEH